MGNKNKTAPIQSGAAFINIHIYISRNDSWA